MNYSNKSADTTHPHFEPICSTPYEKYLPNPSPAIKILLSQASGPLSHSLTNDYLFRALLQENNYVLKCLICAVLYLPLSLVGSVEITNPILLGRDISDKTFILDINVLLNDNTIINLEMQVNNFGNWPERSVGYLSRNFQNLNKGDNYNNAKTAIHIGFLDYTLFTKYPEFHAIYKLLNIKNHNLYTDKFILHVIDLNYINVATEEDKAYQLDKWATLFKAKNWEEIKMLASQTPLFESAAETLYQLSSDPAIQWLCEAHQESVATLNYLNRTIDEQRTTIDEQKTTIDEQKTTIDEQKATIDEQKAAIHEQETLIQHLKNRLAEKEEP